MKKNFFFIILVLFYSLKLISQEPRIIKSRDFALILTAECSNNPKPSIKIKWEKNQLASQYAIFRKLLKDANFSNQPLAILDSNTLEFIDNNVLPNVFYDYEVAAYSLGSVQSGGNKVPINFIAYGYVTAGVEVLPPDYFGYALILVDETMLGANGISKEIDQLKEDLREEGWGVIVKTVPRAEKFDGKLVKDVKKIVRDEFANTNNRITALYLIGRVPVPYSGDLNPDAHPEHRGAWPADIYYSYVDSEFDWTDNIVNRVLDGQREENKNVPGDGKFDQSTIESREARFGVGRVDFYNMDLFFSKDVANPELELVRKYLIRSHKYRTGQLPVKWEGLIDNNFNPDTNPELAFASSGWRNLGSIVGIGKIKEGDILTLLSQENYLFTYGCGPGSYQSAGGIGSSTDFSKANLNGIFTMLFGSYFGDWDSKNNLMRAALAANPGVLTCSWAGRPHWYYHQMAANIPIASSALLSHNNLVTYKPNVVFTSQYPNGVIYAVGMKQIHTALMGDPTLRLYSSDVPAPKNLVATFLGKYKTKLTWDAPPLGGPLPITYNIYRSNSKYGLYERINQKPITENEFTDSINYDGEMFYQVRAIRIQNSNTANFYNMSRGIFASVVLSDVEDNSNLSNLEIYPNPASNFINIDLQITNSSIYELSIFDILGNNVRNIINEFVYSGNYNFRLELKDNSGNKLPSGIYYLKLSNGKNSTSKLIAITE